MVDTFSLFELNEHIRRVIALNFEEPIWVKCEISQVGSSRGHYYLDFIQKEPESEDIRAQNRGALWARNYYSLKKKYGEILEQVLQDGVEVRIKVKVDYHERYGLKLIVEDIDPEFTLGNLELKRREILEELHKRDLIEQNSRLDTPLVLQRIAVLSAEHAAGYQDFKQHLLTNPQQYSFDVELYDVALQGTRVEDEVVEALQEIGRVQSRYDCVVIIRGGGSRIDLGSFDSLAIGEAIAQCPLPVLTGIGHEIDTTVPDVVAHTSLKTPTAVAGFLVEHNEQFEAEIEERFNQITYLIDNYVTQARSNLEGATAALSYLPKSYLASQHKWLDMFIPQFRLLQSGQIRRNKEFLGHAEAIMKSLDPVNTLARGYSITRLNGVLVRETQDVAPGDVLESELADGKIISKVQ